MWVADSTDDLHMDDRRQTTAQVRNAVRAVIVRDDAILVQRKEYPDGRVRYTLPGGKPNPGETLEQGLRRECLEELGSSIEVIELLHVAEFYKSRDTDPPSQRQQVEFLFQCRVPATYVAANGCKPDKRQVDVVWLPLGDDSRRDLFPPSLTRILTCDPSESRVYLGLID
jgi:ADP-ribose pyrophosphatase YjhB (NUDIX family)